MPQINDKIPKTNKIEPYKMTPFKASSFKDCVTSTPIKLCKREINRLITNGIIHSKIVSNKT